MPTPTQTVEPTGTPTGPDRPAEVGDTVRVDYTGTLDDGTQFDSSFGREPLQFTIGGGQMIPGFDQAVIGMKRGEVKTVVIPPDEAYGPYREELVVEFDREDLPAGQDWKVGDPVSLQVTGGQIIPATVIEVTESTIKVDANHRLAGKNLTFEIHLVEIL
ncbi:MAG: peptidylprolyl isomerase [Dehalococcoidia bacterium]|nr:MAG: peptidylprolyl isomerase [Dehalococcoidia bacterium]UCG84620.1 MAG: peptidylprolyl isomerase [Dehalococcoidia bacterium]